MPEPERNQKNGHAERAKKNSVEFIVSFFILHRAAILFWRGLRGWRQNSVEPEINRFGSVVIIPAIA